MWIQQAWIHNALATHGRRKGQTKMMNERLEATFKFVALPWLKFGEVLEVIVWAEDVVGTLVAVCRCHHFPNSVKGTVFQGRTGEFTDDQMPK